MAAVDPRLGAVLADVRVATGRPVLKALRRGRMPLTPPSAAQVEAERPFWGPHPDPEIAFVEDQFWSVGEMFLRGLLSHAIGRQVRALQKAFHPKAPQVPGWGDLMSLFRSDLEPERLMQGWQTVIDRLVGALLPGDTREQAAQALALRASLLHRAGERVAYPERFPSWGLALREAPSRAASEVLQWTKVRAVERMTALTADARHALLTVLVDSREAGDGVGKLQQRLYDGFSGLNRDWRRVALTETALAVSNGALASVDPAEGWLAEWKAVRSACPYCKAMGGRRFRMVAPDAARKDGDTQVWVGKSNVGRSAHRWSRKEERFRERDEMWWPTIPAHPNCGCTWVLRRSPMGAHR
jgi:hypothetical protein